MQSAAPDTVTDERSWHARREFVILGVALLVGLILMPLLIWAAGHFVLGAYAHGGPLQLLGDYLAGLGHGSLIFWAVALGPYLLVCLSRLLYAFARGRI